MKFRPWMVVVAFVCLLCFGFCKETQADVQINVGPAFLSGEGSGGVAVLAEHFDKYTVGLGYISEQTVWPSWEADRGLPEVEVKENLFVFGERTVGIPLPGCGDWHCLELGLGVAYFNETNRALGSKFTAALSVEVRPTDRWSITIRHFSNAGSATPNMGQDMLTLGYRF